MSNFERQAMTTRVLIFLLTLLFSMSVQAEYSSPEHVEGSITTSVTEAKALYDKGVVFIDVRNPRLYAKGHIVDAHHLDLKNGFTEDAVAALVSRDEPLVIYCSGVKCSRSYRAVAKAVGWGFRQVHYFRGGIVEWREAGYPVKASSVE
jgi:rhodanese-related sulfurtransferase